MTRRTPAAKENGPVTALTVPRPINPIPNASKEIEPMNSRTNVPATNVTNPSVFDPFALDLLPCESFAWCEGHEAGERKHNPEDTIHLGEDKTIWRETTAEANRMNWDVLAQRARKGPNGADTIAVSFEIEGHLSTLELPGFALALEGMAEKFRALAAELA
jgi:hypothetical protein